MEQEQKPFSEDDESLLVSVLEHISDEDATFLQMTAQQTMTMKEPYCNEYFFMDDDGETTIIDENSAPVIHNYSRSHISAFAPSSIDDYNEDVEDENVVKNELYEASLRFEGDRLPKQSVLDSAKLTVVLDLDETLICTLRGEQHPVEDSFQLIVNSTLLTVRKRPFLDRFLKKAAKKFELILFTAGTRDYAARILQTLDPMRTLFRHCLSRQHCLLVDKQKFMKDLNVVNRDLRRTVLVDNNMASFVLDQMSNGILIRSFDEGNYKEEDNQLLLLYNLLKDLTSEEDVRVRLSELHAQTRNKAEHQHQNQQEQSV